MGKHVVSIFLHHTLLPFDSKCKPAKSTFNFTFVTANNPKTSTVRQFLVQSAHWDGFGVDVAKALWQ